MKKKAIYKLLNRVAISISRLGIGWNDVFRFIANKKGHDDDSGVGGQREDGGLGPLRYAMTSTDDGADSIETYHSVLSYAFGMLYKCSVLMCYGNLH